MRMIITTGDSEEGAHRVSEEMYKKVALLIMAETHPESSERPAGWRWADEVCIECNHVHRAYGVDIKHCPVCGISCKHYGETSFVSAHEQ